VDNVAFIDEAGFTFKNRRNKEGNHKIGGRQSPITTTGVTKIQQ
jgi:hypothetical protein